MHLTDRYVELDRTQVQQLGAARGAVRWPRGRLKATRSSPTGAPGWLQLPGDVAVQPGGAAPGGAGACRGMGAARLRWRGCLPGVARLGDAGTYCEMGWVRDTPAPSGGRA